MSYDRTKTAGVYDNRLTRAEAKAKGHWGTGWTNLTDEMQQAYVAYFLVQELAAIDFDEVTEQMTAEKLADRLRAMSSVLNAATATR